MISPAVEAVLVLRPKFVRGSAKLSTVFPVDTDEIESSFSDRMLAASHTNLSLELQLQDQSGTTEIETPD